MTLSVYAAEDAFQLLPIHWMWWPALGGVVIGIGGLIVPQALGVGYETIEALLQGGVPTGQIVGILLVKWIIWSMSLGSGTSGAVLAPFLMMGGGLGGLETMILPDEGLGFWPLVSMGAILGGTLRSPFTGIVFSLELTHEVNILLPLLVAVTLAHAFTVLTLRHSILTVKVSRRGYHLSREYAVDPLEILFVRDVMRTNSVALPATIALHELAALLSGDRPRRQRLYPVVAPEQRLVGVVSGSDLQTLLQALPTEGNGRQLTEVIRPDPVVAYPDEPLRVVVYRMAEAGVTRLPVVSHHSSRQFVGIIALSDLLKARVHHLEEERRRQRVLQIRLLWPRGPRRIREAAVLRGGDEPRAS